MCHCPHYLIPEWGCLNLRVLAGFEMQMSSSCASEELGSALWIALQKILKQWFTDVQFSASFHWALKGDPCSWAVSGGVRRQAGNKAVQPPDEAGGQEGGWGRRGWLKCVWGAGRASWGGSLWAEVSRVAVSLLCWGHRRGEGTAVPSLGGLTAGYRGTFWKLPTREAKTYRGAVGLAWWSSGWLCTPKAGGPVSGPGQETKTPTCWEFNTK